MHEDEERHLIRSSQAGEVAAFQQLAEEQAAPLWRCAFALCKDRHWAEDIAQETLIEAWRSIGRFDSRRCRFSTWLYGILRHRFLKRRRGGAAAMIAADVLARQPCTTPPPDRSAEASEDALRVHSAVDDLPEEHRRVVELRFFAGAALDEIAAALGCPLGTVKSRLHHALEKLRQMNLAVNLFGSVGQSQERKP